MAAVRQYIYRGGGQEVIPGDATHVRIDESVTAIPDYLFAHHENIVEVICHDNVKDIESGAFYMFHVPSFEASSHARGGICGGKCFLRL